MKYVHAKNNSEKCIFLCFRVPLKVDCFCTILWFISLNRIFIRLFNDNKLKCILPISYYILLKQRELRETAPEVCCLTLSMMAGFMHDLYYYYAMWIRFNTRLGTIIRNTCRGV